MFIEHLHVRVERVLEIPETSMQQLLDLISTVSHLAGVPVAPLQERNVVQLAALLNIRLEHVVGHVLANTAYFSAESVTLRFVLGGGLALDLTKDLVPHVAQHFDLSVFSGQLVSHGGLDVRDLLDEQTYILTRPLFLHVLEQHGLECFDSALTLGIVHKETADDHASHTLLFMHMLFAAAPAFNALAPDLSNLQVEVATFKFAFSLLPFVVVGPRYLGHNLLEEQLFEHALDHDLLLAQFDIKVDVAGAQLTESFPLSLIEDMHGAIEALSLLSQLLYKLQVLKVTLRQYRSLKRLIEVLELVEVGRQGYVLPDMVTRVYFGALGCYLLGSTQLELFRCLLVQLTALASVINVLHDGFDELRALACLRRVLGHIMNHQLSCIKIL